MKVYMCVDMEGISGVVLKEQVFHGNPEREEARHLLIQDANAAVDGALAGGATEIVVQDGHGSGFNFPLDELHPKADYVMGPPPTGRFVDLDQYDVMFLVGYHAMSGTLHAIRDHTMSSTSWQKFTLNGVEMGEVEIDAIYAGYFGVPIGLVTGDDKVCAEATRFLGDIPTAQVKIGLGRHCAKIKPPVVAHEIIRRKAAEAAKMTREGSLQPYRVEGPCEIQIQFTSTDMVDSMRMEGKLIERLDGQTVAFRGENVHDALLRAIR